METGNLYVVEGMDGVGKSSTGQALADRLDAEYFDTFDDEFNEFKQWVKDPEQDHSWGTRLLFYLGGTAARADTMQETLDNGTDVVVDRYFTSVLSYHCASTDDEPEDVMQYTERIPDPDAMIYLHVDEDERLHRLDERGEGGHDRERDTEFMSTMGEYYREIGEQYEFIEAEAVGGVETVADEIYDELVTRDV